MEDCIFCKIVRGEIPSDKVFENDQLLVFKDINPQAPVHLLLVPKQHHADILELAAAKDRSSIMDSILAALPQIAAQVGLDQKGFRLINNCGPEGGQTVMHLHFHLLGGRSLDEKIV